jgi:Uma2 family endonuclease
LQKTLAGLLRINVFDGTGKLQEVALERRDYNASMSLQTAGYLDAIAHLPEGATLVFHQMSWDEYERLLEDLWDRPHLRLTYDCGKLEVMSPLFEHDEYASFIDDLVRVLSEELQVTLEKRGRATWKRRRLDRGLEADACYYVANAERIIGRRKIDLDSDPPPDIAVEVDITNETLRKLPLYAAFRAPEIWRYDGKKMQFYRLTGNAYREISESGFFVGLKPALLADALEQSKSEGQTKALAAFREKCRNLNLSNR